MQRLDSTAFTLDLKSYSRSTQIRSFDKGGSQGALKKKRNTGEYARILFYPHAALSSRTFKETINQIYLDRKNFHSNLKNTFSKTFMIGSEKKYIESGI